MVSAELVQSHAVEVLARSAAFSKQISIEVDAIGARLISKLASTITTTSERRIKLSPKNIDRLYDIPSLFRELSEKSLYHATTLAYVSGFADHVDRFSGLYSPVRAQLALPEFRVLPEHADILGKMAAGAVASWSYAPLLVEHALRTQTLRSFSETSLSDFLDNTMQVVRKMSNVEHLAKEQSMVFFRTVGCLWFSHVESLGRRLRFSYVGASTPQTRKFCSSLSGEYGFSEILAMDNGKVPGVFENGGGHGCMHWWMVSS